MSLLHHLTYVSFLVFSALSPVLIFVKKKKKRLFLKVFCVWIYLSVVPNFFGKDIIMLIALFHFFLY